MSLGSTLPEGWRLGILSIGAGLLLLAILSYALLAKPGHPSVVFAIALVSAGGIGNLVDRIAQGGMVLDFMNVGIGPLRTGIFSIADVEIVAGLLILFITSLRRKKKVR